MRTRSTGNKRVPAVETAPHTRGVKYLLGCIKSGQVCYGSRTKMMKKGREEIKIPENIMKYIKSLSVDVTGHPAMNLAAHPG